MNGAFPSRGAGSGAGRVIAVVALALVSVATGSCGPDQERTAGMEALLSAREALGGEAFAEIRNLRLRSETRATRGQATVTLPFTMVMTTDGKFRLERELRNGSTMTVVDDGERMMIRTDGGTRPARDSIRRRITIPLWWNLAYLMTNLDREGLEARELGSRQVSATTYREVEVSPPMGSPFVLLLHSESMRPDRVRYTVPLEREPVDAVEIYREFRPVAGIRLPHRTVTYRGERVSSETVYTSIEANVELEEGFFSLEAETGEGEGGEDASPAS